MDPQDLLDLFNRLVAQAVVELNGLDDWGLSGGRETQYRHDVVADDVIVGGLRAAGLGVLSEESGLVDDGAITVVVDPVDGSTNASLGLPWYASSLCAVDAEGPLAALVVNLATGDRFSAVRGGGARRDQAAWRVTAGPGAANGAEPPVAIGGPVGGAELRPSGCERLTDAIVAFSGYPGEQRSWNQFRVLGAAALDLCAVAAGNLDGYVDIDRAHGVWDYLGALLVCREAGVAVVDWGGEDLVTLDPTARRGPVAAATTALTDELVDMARAGDRG